MTVTYHIRLFRYFGGDSPVTPMLRYRQIAEEYGPRTADAFSKALCSPLGVQVGGERVVHGDLLLFQPLASGYYAGREGLKPVNLRTGDGEAVVRNWEKRLEGFNDEW